MKSSQVISLYKFGFLPTLFLLFGFLIIQTAQAQTRDILLFAQNQSSQEQNIEEETEDEALEEEDLGDED